MALIDYEFPGKYCLARGPQNAGDAFSQLRAHFKDASNKAGVNGFQLERRTSVFGDEYIMVTQEIGGRRYPIFQFSKINYPLTGYFRGRESDYKMESLWGWNELHDYSPGVCESSAISRGVIRSFATLFNIGLKEVWPGADWHFTGRD